MATACRSAVVAGARSITARSKTPLLKSLLSPKSSTPSPFSPSTRASAASRMAAVLGSVESMMPLHSVIASVRLRSSIAVDSTCWSLLSQDFAVPRDFVASVPLERYRRYLEYETDIHSTLFNSKGYVSLCLPCQDKINKQSHEKLLSDLIEKRSNPFLLVQFEDLGSYCFLMMQMQEWRICFQETYLMFPMLI
ncbi:hypothetical protein Vadar_001261 [Vaccinium darrowii]|uniref:Uncharacterized protein n=1 Tax=Vaccinium darrowii TaxID=229202 RepID=A0ACB7WX02_9ERIC|nr:hypothetical protein Vadar_001261 [Vaccinium darrowii]